MSNKIYINKHLTLEHILEHIANKSAYYCKLIPGDWPHCIIMPPFYKGMNQEMMETGIFYEVKSYASPYYVYHILFLKKDFDRYTVYVCETNFKWQGVNYMPTFYPILFDSMLNQFYTNQTDTPYSRYQPILDPHPYTCEPVTCTLDQAFTLIEDPRPAEEWFNNPPEYLYHTFTKATWNSRIQYLDCTEAFDHREIRNRFREGMDPKVLFLRMCDSLINGKTPVEPNLIWYTNDPLNKDS